MWVISPRYPTFDPQAGKMLSNLSSLFSYTDPHLCRFLRFPSQLMREKNPWFHLNPKWDTWVITFPWDPDQIPYKIPWFSQWYHLFCWFFPWSAWSKCPKRPRQTSLRTARTLPVDLAEPSDVSQARKNFSNTSTCSLRVAPPRMRSWGHITPYNIVVAIVFRTIV